MATESELSDFLASVEKRAYRRTVYHVRDEEAAQDIVQESMLRLAQRYGHRPAAELPLLFQRILSNCTLDWFRRQKTRHALFTTLADLAPADDEGDGTPPQPWGLADGHAESAEDALRRAEFLRILDALLAALPARQREAFLMRYWEDMDVAETAAAMGCSPGSVKTHCLRAIATLGKALKARGMAP